MSKLITIIILFITTVFIFSVIQSIHFEFSYAQQEPNQTTNSDYSQIIDDNVFTTLREGNAVLSLSNNQTWSAGPDMTYMDSTNDGETIIASSGDNHVYVFNNKDKVNNNNNNNELIAKIKVGETPRGVKISPDEKDALVANEVSGTISIIDFKNMTVIKEVPVGKIPHNIVFSTDYNDNNKKLAYITMQGEDKIIIMDMNTFDKVGEIAVSKGPHNLDITPDGKYLFVANAGSSDVAVIDIANKQVIKTIPVSTGHHGIDVSPDGKMVYVSGIGSDKVNVIDPIKLELVKQIDVGNGPHGIRIGSDGKLLYVDVTSTNKVVLIDTEQLKIINNINTGKSPFWIAIPNNS
jgi:YVTN family beta-propeller protein